MIDKKADEQDRWHATTHTLQGLCEFTLKKIKSLKSQDGSIYSQSQSIEQDMAMMSGIIKLYSELSSILFGLIVSIEYGDFDKAKAFYERMLDLNNKKVYSLYEMAEGREKFTDALDRMYDRMGRD